MKELEFLREQQVDKGLIEGVEEFRCKYSVEDGEQGRVSCPDMYFTAGKCWKWELQLFFREKICCLQEQRQRERMFWQKIWHGFSDALFIMFLFM